MSKKEISMERAEFLLKLDEYDDSTDRVNGDIIGTLYHSNMMESWRTAFEGVHIPYLHIK